jgi:hypothetical protein
VPGALTAQSVLVDDVEEVVGTLAGAAAGVEPVSLEPDGVEDDVEPSLDEDPSLDAPLEVVGEAVLLDEESRESVR